MLNEYLFNNYPEELKVRIYYPSLEYKRPILVEDNLHEIIFRYEGEKELPPTGTQMIFSAMKIMTMKKYVNSKKQKRNEEIKYLMNDITDIENNIFDVTIKCIDFLVKVYNEYKNNIESVEEFNWRCKHLHDKEFEALRATIEKILNQSMRIAKMYEEMVE